MDRDWTLEAGEETGPAAFVLPSRREALDVLLAAVKAEAGLLLLTGEAGSGKTWLVRRLAAEHAPAMPWLLIDVTPAMGPAELLLEIAAGLGLDVRRPHMASSGSLRLALSGLLAERAADGRRWGLVVDEAHLAGAELLEEVRVLSNRLGQPDGFSAIVLVGQTALARRLETWPLSALEARLAAKVHLRPIDADEAMALISRLEPGRARDIGEIERRHRDAAGNPRRLLRFDPPARPSRSKRLSSAPRPAPARPATLPETAPEPRPTPAPSPEPAIMPSRPPLRVEDGLIEVGWEAEPSSGDVEPREPSPQPASRDVEEPINDHYAALQAWNEWSRNQGRSLEDLEREFETHPEAAGTIEPDLAEGMSEDDPPPEFDRPNLRAEGQQTFAPYSQLFSRLRQAKEGD